MCRAAVQAVKWKAENGQGRKKWAPARCNSKTMVWIWSSMLCYISVHQSSEESCMYLLFGPCWACILTRKRCVCGLTTLRERYKNEMTFREGRYSQFRWSAVCPEVLIKTNGLQDSSWNLHHCTATASKRHVVSIDCWCIFSSQSHFHLILPVVAAAGVVLNNYFGHRWALWHRLRSERSMFILFEGKEWYRGYLDQIPS